jgi:predicted TIM-barrel fold metal-dependent hydrolase
MDTKVNLDSLELVEAAERRPKGKYLLTEGIVSARPGSDLWPRLKALDFYIELSRMSSLLPKVIPAIVQYLGPERFLFGMGFPFKTPSPAFLKVSVLDESDAVKQQILGVNAAGLFIAVQEQR